MIDTVGSLRALICSLQSVKAQLEVYQQLVAASSDADDPDNPPAVHIEPGPQAFQYTRCWWRIPVAEPENESRIKAILPPLLT
jgi:hypothetical protein